jgi:hypothetical protein
MDYGFSNLMHKYLKLHISQTSSNVNFYIIRVMTVYVEEMGKKSEGYDICIDGSRKTK